MMLHSFFSIYIYSSMRYVLERKIHRFELTFVLDEKVLIFVQHTMIDMVPRCRITIQHDLGFNLLFPASITSFALVGVMCLTNSIRVKLEQLF